MMVEIGLSPIWPMREGHLKTPDHGRFQEGHAGLIYLPMAGFQLPHFPQVVSPVSESPGCYLPTRTGGLAMIAASY
jgi:hypothetical protein